MIKFLYPQYLLLCLLVIPSSIFYLIRIKNLVKIIGKEAKNYIIKLKFRTLLFSLSWLFLCIALASPIYGTRLVLDQKKGASVIFVMDISNSMTIKENEVSRLNTSKYLADFIVKKYNQHSFGLVLAKGNGVLSVPLTFEKISVLENINLLSPLRVSSSGTNLELGVLKAIDSFNNERSNSKIIILFTDGDETKGNLLDVAKAISESDVTLIIVGVGTKEGGEIEITGIKSNKEFFNIYSGKVQVPKGFEIIEVGEIPENFQKQGFRTDGKLIGTKNGEGFPKKTDKIIRIRKIKK